MAHITLGGSPAETTGTIPQVGSTAPNFTLVAKDLSTKSLSDFDGFRKILNIFPSVDTNICAVSTRKFNQEASDIENTKVLCISKDLPFAQARFCAAENIDNAILLSDFRDGNFGNDYGLTLISSGFEGLHSRVVIVLNENNKVIYAEQVPEIGQEPNYDAAIKTLC
jgi:thiol peroxidase